MSRSKKKTPIYSITCAKSEKSDKKIWHSKFRHKEKQRLKSEDLEDFITTDKKEVSNNWDFAKDVKTYYSIKDYENFKRKYPNIDYPLNKYLKLFRK